MYFLVGYFRLLNPFEGDLLQKEPEVIANLLILYNFLDHQIVVPLRLQKLLVYIVYFLELFGIVMQFFLHMRDESLAKVLGDIFSVAIVNNAIAFILFLENAMVFFMVRIIGQCRLLVIRFRVLLVLGVVLVIGGFENGLTRNDKNVLDQENFVVQPDFSYFHEFVPVLLAHVIVYLKGRGLVIVSDRGRVKFVLIFILNAVQYELFLRKNSLGLDPVNTNFRKVFLIHCF